VATINPVDDRNPKGPDLEDIEHAEANSHHDDPEAKQLLQAESDAWCEPGVETNGVADEHPDDDRDEDERNESIEPPGVIDPIGQRYRSNDHSCR
jgi:hypothetical protein